MKHENLTLEDYSIQREFVGNPSNKIYLVRHDQTQQLFIYKQIRLQNYQNQMREIQAQKNLKHRFIIRLLKYKVGRGSLDLLIEYASRGDLFDYINRLSSVQEIKILEMFYKIVIAIDFIHSNGFIHRDIKPENILIGDDGEPKLADFGSSVSKKVVRNTFCGTYEYMAPEIYMREKQTEKIDIWALGILIFEMMHNVTPFREKNIYEIKDMIENRELPFGSQISSRVRQIVWKILRVDPQLRPSAREILMFPEFNVISGKFKHMIPNNNVEDLLNFHVLKGRILTMNDSGNEREKEKQREKEAHEKMGFDEKKMLKRELEDFKKNFRLPPSVEEKLQKNLNITNNSTMEYNYLLERDAGQDNPPSRINIYRDSGRGQAEALEKTMEKETPAKSCLVRQNLEQRRTKPKQTGAGKQKGLGKRLNSFKKELFGHQKTRSRNLFFRKSKREKFETFMKTSRPDLLKVSKMNKSGIVFGSNRMAHKIQSIELNKKHKAKQRLFKINRMEPKIQTQRNFKRAEKGKKSGRRLEKSRKKRGNLDESSRTQKQTMNHKVSSMRSIQGFSFGKIIRNLLHSNRDLGLKSGAPDNRQNESNISKYMKEKKKREKWGKRAKKMRNIMPKKEINKAKINFQSHFNVSDSKKSQMKSMTFFRQELLGSAQMIRPKARNKIHSQKRIRESYKQMSNLNVSSNHVNEYNFSVQIPLKFLNSSRLIDIGSKKIRTMGNISEKKDRKKPAIERKSESFTPNLKIRTSKNLTGFLKKSWEPTGM